MKVFSRESYKTFKNFFFTEHLRKTASGVATFEKTFRWLLPLLLSSPPTLLASQKCYFVQRKFRANDIKFHAVFRTYNQNSVEIFRFTFVFNQSYAIILFRYDLEK